MTSDLSAPPLDPLAPLVGGRYVDDLVEVSARARPPASSDLIRTAHFDVDVHDGRVRVGHRVPPPLVDDDLAGLLADELFAPGWLRGPVLFERLFTGVVRSVTPDPLDAWELFYRNTLARIAESVTPPAGQPAGGRHGTVADYAPVYAHAESLLAPGSVLELGSCFGFLSLRIAATGRTVTASDVTAGTVRVLAAVAPRLGVPLRTRVADAARYPADPGCADTVLVVHLLEHLDADHGDQVLAEAVRLAARRVVVAVPLEDEAEETWGHVRTVSLADLATWGRRTGLPCDVHEHHGGWLVLDTA